MKKHRANDKKDICNLTMEEEEKKHLKNLRTKVIRIKTWLEENEDKDKHTMEVI
ncbi:MAG: hypothetical protein ACE5IH_01220 [Thermodesulfobacteriota bacterium]